MNSAEKEPSHLSTENMRSKSGRSWIGNLVCGFLLVMDLGAGSVLLFLGPAAINNPPPWGLNWTIVVLGCSLVVQGLILIVAGVMLVAFRSPRCWKVGRWTHTIAGLGYFGLIAAIWQESQYTLSTHPGHGAIEGALGGGIISLFVGVFGVAWLAVAGLCAVLAGKERAPGSVPR